MPYPATVPPLDLPAGTEDFRRQVLTRGITVAGFGDVSEGLAPDLRHLPVAISLGLLNGPGAVDRPAYDHTGGTADARLLGVQKWIVGVLRASGHRYLAIPPDSHRADRRFVSRLYPLFAHKTAATCAGLGWIGRNGLLIHPDHGPRLLWATVLTDAPLAVDPPTRESRCGRCDRCVRVCPVGAIHGRAWRRDLGNECMLDVDACRSELEANRARLGLAACGVCLNACPYGRKDSPRAHTHPSHSRHAPSAGAGSRAKDA